MSLVLAFILSQSEDFHNFLLGLGELEYLGAFVAGVLFVFTYTVATGLVILLILSENLSPLLLATVAALGAVVGDFLIFRFVKDNLVAEINVLFNLFGGKTLGKIFKSKYFSWLLPIIGAIIIASPLPDEIGVAMMGLSNVKSAQFVFLSYLLNFLGIYIIVTLPATIVP